MLSFKALLKQEGHRRLGTRIAVPKARGKRLLHMVGDLSFFDLELLPVHVLEEVFVVTLNDGPALVEKILPQAIKESRKHAGVVRLAPDYQAFLARLQRKGADAGHQRLAEGLFVLARRFDDRLDLLEQVIIRLNIGPGNRVEHGFVAQFVGRC